MIQELAWFSKDQDRLNVMLCYDLVKLSLIVGSALSYWRGGHLQHHNSIWLQSAAELKKSAQLLDLAGSDSHRPHPLLSSANQQLETEWEMCRREYDARIALMMLMEARNPTGVTSPTPTVESRPPAPPLMKLLDGADHYHHPGLTSLPPPRSIRHTDHTVGWRFLSQVDPTKPQVTVTLPLRYCRLRICQLMDLGLIHLTSIA